MKVNAFNSLKISTQNKISTLWTKNEKENFKKKEEKE